MSDIDSTRLRELLNYNPDTGVFTWRTKVSRKVVVGAVAGNRVPAGYVHIQVNGVRYYAHRLAWCFVYGSWPTSVVDHINGIKDDNRIANLRDVSQRANTQNTSRPRKDNPYLGVSKKRNKWLAQISDRGKHVRIGLFDTPEAAHEAYVEAKRKLHAGCTI